MGGRGKKEGVEKKEGGKEEGSEGQRKMREGGRNRGKEKGGGRKYILKVPYVLV